MPNYITGSCLSILVGAFALTLLPCLVQPEQLAWNVEAEYQANFKNDNFTRPKRQLFREDIPHHRPLSGNLYAQHHGFPHPGRWSDGLKNQPKPSINLPPSHQTYLDAIDNNQLGHYQSNRKPKLNSHKPVLNIGYDNDNNINLGEGNGVNDYEFPPSPPPSSYGFGNEGISFQSGPHFGFPEDIHEEPTKAPYQRPTYGPPEVPKHKPKVSVHYHPVQYGSVINFPESKPTQKPSQGYGPPNHQSGPPIGPSYQQNVHPQQQYGFTPMKHYGSSDNSGGYHNKGSGHYDGGKDRYKSDPFNFFPSPPNHNYNHNHKPLEIDLPIPVPILAQFHSPKPVKFIKLKPHYQHQNNNNYHRPKPHGQSHSPPRRRPPQPYFQNPFLSAAVKKPHWLVDYMSHYGL